MYFVDVDIDEALRDYDLGDRVVFSKRLERGAKRLHEDSARQFLFVSFATSLELERFTYMLMEEAHDERMHITRRPKSNLMRLVSNGRL